jgi:hypothetical protein
VIRVAALTPPFYARIIPLRMVQDIGRPQGAGGAAPPGVVLPTVFFLVAGVLDVALRIRELPAPLPFWPVWESVGSGLAHWLVAYGLWKRVAVVRSLALVYCLGSVIVYLFALVLAYTGAPVHFPDYVVLQSLYQVPSCTLLFNYLRSEPAGHLYTRPLLP